jgi:hypothetical protein
MAATGAEWEWARAEAKVSQSRRRKEKRQQRSCPAAVPSQRPWGLGRGRRAVTVAACVSVNRGAEEGRWYTTTRPAGEDVEVEEAVDVGRAYDTASSSVWGWRKAMHWTGRPSEDSGRREVGARRRRRRSAERGARGGGGGEQGRESTEAGVFLWEGGVSVRVRVRGRHEA